MNIARFNDIHEGICGHGFICCPHNVSGPIVQASGNVSANGLGLARLGDEVRHNCPHCGTGEIVEGSPTVSANGKPVARIGDKVVYPGGGGVIVKGSSDVFAG